MPLRAIATLAGTAVVSMSIVGAPPGVPARGPLPTQAGSAPSVAVPETFAVDFAHSTLHYKLRHFGVSDFYGRVNQPKGTFRIDDTDLAGSHLTITIELKNMDTGNDGRDRFLMGADFFNAREFPTAEFKSRSISRVDDATYEATGDFTMRGVTKPITVRLEHYTVKRLEKFGLRAGFECTFTVSRSDHGINKFVEEGTLGDAVTILASIEGVHRPE